MPPYFPLWQQSSTVHSRKLVVDEFRFNIVTSAALLGNDAFHSGNLAIPKLPTGYGLRHSY